ncbi:MAG: hypothetical protein JWN14_1347, partial [Chthonomonadales bacterium]|nr:hypothetical protein [Chthonomonadales bacterium]
MNILEGRLEVHLLGRCEILVNGMPPASSLSIGAGAILAHLILYRNRPLTRQGIGEMIWDPTQFANSPANFRQGLRRLRQALAEEKWRIHESQEGPVKPLRLELQNAKVDVVQFEEALQTARQTHTLPDWEQALQVYRGDLLAGYEAFWVQPLREALRQEWLKALEGGAEAAQQDNLLDKAQTMLQMRLQSDPCCERIARNLMNLLAEHQKLDEARNIYHALRQRLRESGQNFVESETASLYGRLQSSQRPGHPASSRTDVAPPKPLLPRLQKLPAPVSKLIGRMDELGRIARAIATSRCVTLTGPGGVGKTRLALEVAWKEEAGFQEGAAFVDFSSLQPGISEADIHRMVAETLGGHEAAGKSWQEQIITEIGQRHLLLVFDNCEQIMQICIPLVERLLSSCPYLHILATSREPLHARGERRLQIPPLSHPREDTPYSQRDLLRYYSVQLFLERVTLSDFSLTDADVVPLAWLCRTLDGMPLAIELAAAQLEYFATIENLNARLRQSFWFLQEISREDIPRRYQVLRETIAWSYDLLLPEEQNMLRALSIFGGGGTEEAIIAITEIPDSVALLQRLLRKSLLSLFPRSTDADPNAPQRYYLTEPIRQYVLEKLLEAQEQEDALQRHATYFLMYVERAEKQLQGVQMQIWLRRLYADQENWRAAMRRTLQNSDTEAALRFGVALCKYWAIRGQEQEGKTFLRKALALPGEVSMQWRMRALNGAGNLAYLSRDHSYSKECFSQCREISQSMGNLFFEACALTGLANAAIGEQDYTNAHELLLQTVKSFKALGDVHNVAIVYGNLATVATYQGDNNLAVLYYHRSITIFRQLSDRQNLVLALNNLFHTLFLEDIAPELPGLLQEALGMSLEIASPPL